MANYGRILEGLRLPLIDAAQTNWTDTITPDNHQWLEARCRLELDNFGHVGSSTGMRNMHKTIAQYWRIKSRHC